MVEKLKLLLVLLLAINFMACGVRVKSDPIKVGPVVVEHRIILNTDNLYKAYQESCKTEVADSTDTAAVNACADAKLNDFLERFTYLG